jgi:hypothetical protein
MKSDPPKRTTAAASLFLGTAPSRASGATRLVRYLTWVKPVCRSLFYRHIVAALGGSLAGPSAVFVITNEVNQKVRQDRAAIVFFKDNAQASAGTLRTGTSCLRQSMDSINPTRFRNGTSATSTNCQHHHQSICYCGHLHPSPDQVGGEWSEKKGRGGPKKRRDEEDSSANDCPTVPRVPSWLAQSSGGRRTASWLLAREAALEAPRKFWSHKSK